MFGFNKYQSAEKFENERSQLFNDFQLFTKVEASDKLKTYIELKKETESPQFQTNKSSIEALSYKGSAEEKLEKEFISLNKNSDIKRYFIVEKSADLKRFNQLAESKTVARYPELEKYIKSGQCSNEMKEFKSNQIKDNITSFANADSSKKLAEYKTLQNSDDIKFYFKYLKLSNYRIYKEVLSSQSIKRFDQLAESKTVARYAELEKYIKSGQYRNEMKEFKSNQKKDSKTSFADSESSKKFAEFKTLQNSDDIKFYFKYLKSSNYRIYKEVLNSQSIKRFNQLAESRIVARYPELEKYIKSGQCKNDMKEFKSNQKRDNITSFANAESSKKLAEFKELNNSDDIKFYFNYLKSSNYKIYKEILNSQLIKRFAELNEKVNGSEFQKKKEYLADKARYQKTDDFKKLEAFGKLKTDSDILLYLKYKDSKLFDFFRNWVPVFDEDFNSKLNTGLWDSTSIHGENGPGRNFSLNGELQYHTSAKNTLVSNSILTLQTRKEKTEGLAWDASKGFVPTTFNYSSAYLHSLKSYKQKFGYLEIKVRARSVKNIINSIALTNELRDVVVQVYTNTGKGIEVGTMRKERESNVIQPFRLKYKPSDFVIISVEWNVNKLEWSINGKIAQTITSNVPTTELGFEILSLVTGEVSESRFPYNFEIDWIRFYNLK